MISLYFIKRPIFALVLSIGIMLAGLAGLMSMAVGRYPDIVPTTVNIRATYPGASAETVETSITQVLEQQLNGIDGLLYFSSSSTSDGQSQITATFVKGTDPDTAQVQVQNKIQRAMSRLPTQVQRQGVTVNKSQTDFLVIVSIADKTGKSTQADISDYLVSNFQDPLSRIEGVGATNIFGSSYAMRIWLDPNRLAAARLMPSDIRQAIERNNAVVSAGQLGEGPSPAHQQLNATVTLRGRLENVEQFQNIIVKSNRDGALVRLSDVARVELGNENYGVASRLNGYPSSGIALQLAPGADALKTAVAVKAKAEALARHMPAGYEISYPRDVTPLIKVSIKEVVKTMAEAILLVVLVMYLFLQSWRATIIPALAVPVVMLGTFGVLSVLGFSINIMTLFGMILSIGLLVDDAIVVVENVERLMDEEKLSPRDATIKSMQEIGGALVGVATVLSAVLLPMAFFGGTTGIIYQQFSITIITSMLLSVVVALILSPALCSMLLKPNHGATHRWADRFNQWFARLTERYLGRVSQVINRRNAFLLGYGAVVLIIWATFVRLPTGFLPADDQGQVLVNYTLPPGATMNRTAEVSREVETYFMTKEKALVEHYFDTTGNSLSGNAQNAGQAYANLTPWDDRPGKDQSSDAIVKRASKAMAKIRDARVIVTNPPAIRGFGRSNGFSFELLNTNGLSRADFLAQRDALIEAATKDPQLKSVRAGTLEDTAQLRVDIDEAKIAALGIGINDVYDTLSASWGASYVNDFIDRGRVKRVYVQADAQFRSLPEDLDSWQVRTQDGTAMVPFSAFATTRWIKGPATLSRFNGVSSYQIQGEAGEGASSGEAMDRMAELQAKTAPATSFAWSGLSYEEQLSHGRAPKLYAISALVVFLCLAALYESWSIPLAVLLVIPLGIVGAVLAVMARGLNNDIYFQVGLLTTMGLAAKNAILIVEFAEAAWQRGDSIRTAAINAARIRFRPILMTSIAFIAGVLPLAFATGAGAQSRIAIGTAVAGGMLTATVLAIYYIPMFFDMVVTIAERVNAKWQGNTSPPAPPIAAQEQQA
ncbi:efflux RND transporter permease subunit [Aquisediminimonas sediminicola]|uniref:efflux RND transporter permease subunit n=1 Tax=Alteraquisediminimonas sediminicola TaxID=2676787 RepID=UPI001C8EF8C5|nr:efflux RND transporter permease subunit [Aquisediminimonas sediminicola]